MNNLKNLAGNGLSIFLFRFVLNGSGISFVLNEGIAEDLYQDVEERLQPLVHVCCETLLRYKHLSVSNTIMDGGILDNGLFEVMLSKGLGSHFLEPEKQRLFRDAKKIADLLLEVMDRRTQEMNEGKKVKGSQPRRRRRPTQDQKKIKKGLEELGKAQCQLAEPAPGKQRRPGLKPLWPEDLPFGVTASRGYDHRGHCLTFEHQTLGELGKIVLIPVRDEHVLIQAELYTGHASPEDPNARRRQVFEEVVAVVNARF